MSLYGNKAKASDLLSFITLTLIHFLTSPPLCSCAVWMLKPLLMSEMFHTSAEA